MKKIVFWLFAVALISSCTNTSNRKEISSNEVGENRTTDVHTANNSLDYEGTYRGALPCADCDSIQIILTLSNNNQYEITSTYYKEDEINRYKDNGKFEWNEEGNTISFDLDGSKEHYFVGENYLKKLDQSGQDITGNIADSYILRK